MSTSAIRFYTFDKLFIGYCLLMVITLLAFGRPLSNYLPALLFYSSMGVLVVLIARYLSIEQSGWRKLLRLLYPVILFTFFYRMTGDLMHLIFSDFFDSQLVAFELALFGVHPTLYIDQHLLNTLTTEIISFCYFSYYLMIPVFLATLYYQQDLDNLKNSLSAISITFFLSYMLFFLYPVEGPRWHFASEYIHQVSGPVFRRMVEFVIANGAVRGGCMPSSHFGVALVLVMYTFRRKQPSRWIWLLLTVGLSVGTVWGRFHYVSDVVVGGIIGLISTLVAWRFVEPHNSGQNQQQKITGVIKNHVA